MKKVSRGGFDNDRLNREAHESFAPDKMTAFPPESIIVGGLIGERIKKTVENNILKLDIENDFLNPFRKKQSRAGDYVGIGKLIDAAVNFSRHPSGAGPAGLKNRLVEELIKTQEDDGYIGTLPAGARVRSLWDVHETAYIIQGLAADHMFYGSGASLEAARRCGDYIVKNRKKLPGAGLSPALAMGGLDRAFLMLADALRDERYVYFARVEANLDGWDGNIVLGRHGRVKGHAYAYINKCLSQIALYRRTGCLSLLDNSKKLINFWLSGDGMLITGAAGQEECWHNTQDGSGGIGETCSTAYSVRLLDELLRAEGRAVYGDIMERIIYNALFSAQSPCGRHIRYYTPLDGVRSYFDRDTYCCPNNYRRIIAELPGMIYYRSNDGITLNLYVNSSIKARFGDGAPIFMEQTTGYPLSGQVMLRVGRDSTRAISIRLRVPGWARGFRVSINDKPFKGAANPGSFMNIRRKWSSGDEVKIFLPMPWRLVKGRVNQAGRAAVMRGPSVFCLGRRLNPGLKEVDLRSIVIDDSSVFPGHEAAQPREKEELQLKAWLPGEVYPSPPSSFLKLSGFAEPDGEFTYLRTQNPGTGTDDELFSGRK